MDDNKQKLIATTLEGVIIRDIPAETEWFELTDTARAWSGQNGVLSVQVIDSEGYWQALYVQGKQASPHTGLTAYQAGTACHAGHVQDCGV